MADRDSSPAFKALSPSARKVLALIDSEVGRCGGAAAISFSHIERRCGVIHGTCGFALRAVRLLGFVTVRLAPGPPRRVNVFQLSDDWQSIDTVKAQRLAAQARLPKSRQRKPVTPRVV